MKLAGALLIVAAAAAWGQILAGKRERRVSELSALVVALHALETEVVFGRTMLRDAWARVAVSVPEVAWLFRRAASYSASGSSAAEAWTEALRGRAIHSELLIEDVRPLSRLSSVLGLTDADDQARHLKLARVALEVHLSEARRRLPGVTRVLRALGWAGGVAAVILLY